LKQARFTRDQGLGIVLLILSAVMSYQTTLANNSRIKGDPGPKLFPLLLCGIIALCAILLIVTRRPEEEEMPKKAFLTKAEAKRFVILYSLYIFFYVLLKYLGYMVAVPVVLFAMVWLFGRPKQVPWWKALIYTAVVCVLLYLLYIVLMKSNLPTGTLFR
jgi:ABC-type Fe3+-siderophore transport system permease subunit